MMQNSFFYSKTMKQILLILAFCIFVIIPCFSQQKNESNIEVEDIIPFNANEYKGWKHIDLGTFSFYFPKELKGGEVKSIDSQDWVYAAEDMKLYVYRGLYAHQPSFDRNKYPNYQENVWLYDNKICAYIWSYEDTKNDLKYVNKSLLTFKELGYFKIELELLSKESISKEITEKIFRSVTLNQK